MKFISPWKRKAWSGFARYLFRVHSSKAVPDSIGLCLTHSCNIRCPYCMREKFKPPEGPMTLEQVKTIMKRMPYVGSVCIMGLCEPFLNPEAPDIIRWLKDEGGYFLSFTTNGMVELTDDRLDALVRVDDFVFSIDSSDPDTFKRLRGGADLKRVMGNLNRLLEFKRKRGLGKMDRPPIHINAVMTSESFVKMPGLIKMLEPYADELTYLMVDPVSRPDYQEFEDPLMLKRDDFEKYIGEFREIARKSPLKVIGLDYMLDEAHNWRDCILSWLDMFIQPNGDAYFCYNYEYVIGNVLKEDPLDVWNSPKAKEFRNKLLTSEPPLMQCHYCNFARDFWQNISKHRNELVEKERA